LPFCSFQSSRIEGRNCVEKKVQPEIDDHVPGSLALQGSSSYAVSLHCKAQLHSSTPQLHPPPLLPYNHLSFFNEQFIAIMEVLLGITGKDFTLIAASKAAMRGATVLKATDDKTRQLNKQNLMAYSGEAGDTGIESISKI
jgi:hypothetical protein